MGAVKKIQRGYDMKNPEKFASNNGKVDPEAKPVKKSNAKK